MHLKIIFSNIHSSYNLHLNFLFDNFILSFFYFFFIDLFLFLTEQVADLTKQIHDLLIKR
jgi:hypothetical protein